MIVKIHGINKKSKVFELIGEIEVRFEEFKVNKVNDLCTTIYNVLFWDSWLSCKPEGLTMYNNPRDYKRETISIIDGNGLTYNYDKDISSWVLKA